MNVTFDPGEKKWKALQTGKIHEEIQYYQEGFHRILKDKLEAMIIPAKHVYGIEGISEDLSEIYSRRTKTINETAERLGMTDPAMTAKLGAMSRPRPCPEF